MGGVSTQECGNCSITVDPSAIPHRGYNIADRADVRGNNLDSCSNRAIAEASW